MADFRNYDPGLYIVTFAGVIIRGFAEGSMIKIERAKDSYSMSVGAGGDVVRVKSRDRTGSVTVTLQSASPSNDALSAIIIADELGSTINAGVGALFVKDLNSNTVAAATNAWIRKITNVEAAMEHTSREWIFDCAELHIFSGGAFR